MNTDGLAINGDKLAKPSHKPKSHEQKSHAVIILASGLSRRLGEPKQLLNKDGEPLISYVTKLALSTKPQRIILVIPVNVPDITHAIDALAVTHPIIQTVKNPTPNTGMAHSLQLGIEAISHFASASIERVLIMGVDQILLDKPHLAALLAGGVRVVASSYTGDNHGQHINNAKDKKQLDKKQLDKNRKANIIGMPLVIDHKLLKSWQATLSGDKGLRHLIRNLPSYEISTIHNNQLSYDIDTPAQLAYAKQQGWLDE